METANLPENGVLFCWKSPSNIALVKYWGKKGNQIPANASLSMTLSEAYTITQVRARKNEKGTGPEVTFRFEGALNNEFGVRIESFIKSVMPWFSFPKDVLLEIESGNNFPHSAGIASSASSMSALALCLCSLENWFTGGSDETEDFFRKASFISRIGSGSACRSVYGKMAVWGQHQAVDGSNDEYAVPTPFDLHPVFEEMLDTVLIVDPGKKKVSSSIGHNLMKDHAFAEARYHQANANLTSLLLALKQGDWNSFALIVENEALSLHAMMMTSIPGYLLMHPNTLSIIDRISEYRKQTGARVCYTLDAGPNIHLLYPKSAEKEAGILINELKSYCYKEYIIDDSMGKGPEKLKCR